MERDSLRMETTATLSMGGRLLLLIVPWLFLCLLGVLVWRLVIPALLHGAVHGYILTAAFLLVGASFTAAAVTMSRDLLAGRYP